MFSRKRVLTVFVSVGDNLQEMSNPVFCVDVIKSYRGVIIYYVGVLVSPT